MRDLQEDPSAAERPAPRIAPRALRENDAAAYCGFSGSYLRNLRCADKGRREDGEPIKGPPWIVIGGAVRYLKEDLDAWLDSHRDPQGALSVGGAA